jgi:hypothetical protein
MERDVAQEPTHVVAQHGQEVVTIGHGFVSAFPLDEQPQIGLLPLADKEVGES